MDYFNIKQYNTTYRSEIFAGLSTFMSIAYILVLNPTILSQVGMDRYGVFVATALSIAITTTIAAFHTRMSLIYAPNIGLSYFFIIFCTEQFDGNWGIALLAVYLSGIGVLICIRYRICKRILETIPECVVHGIKVGMGFCLIKLGLLSCGALKKVGSLYSFGQFDTLECVYSFVGLIIIGLFLRFKKYYGLTFGFGSVYILGIILTFIINYINVGGPFLNYIIETLTHRSSFPNLTEVAFHFPPIEGIFKDSKLIFQLIITVLLMTVITLVNAQDLIRTTAQRLKDDNDSYYKDYLTRCLRMNGIGNIISASLGSSPITVCPENDINSECGAKTGISSLTVSIAMLVTLIFGPLFNIDNMFLSAPLLLFVGGMIIKSVKLDKISSPIERLLFIIITVYLGLTFELVNAILYGISIYIIMKLLAGKKEQLDHSMIFWILCFIVYLVIQLI
ncbi:MAG: NCS2 family permease [Clostridiales bacterium]|nr:NCS2 family permease [Clostridiales bacterium]